MKNMIYKWAKAYVEKRDAQKKEKEEKIGLAHIAAQMGFDKLIADFRKKYLEEVINEFKTNVKPEFEIGEIVTTNWYGEGSSWDGSMRMLQSHTPFEGPIEVEITAIVLDSAEIWEIIDELKNRGEFDNKYTDQHYNSLKMIVDGHRRKYDISWAYKIKVPGDDYQYWCYPIRENKLLKRKCDIARWSKKCFQNELDSRKLNEEKKVLDEKIRRQLERITKTKIIVR